MALAAAMLFLLTAQVARAQNCCPDAQPAPGTVVTTMAPTYYYPSPQASPQMGVQGPCCPFPQGNCPFPQGYCPPPNYCGLCAKPLGNPTPYTPRPLGIPCPTPQASPQGYTTSSPQSFSYPTVPAKTTWPTR